jgi:hypothetical protein
VNLWGAIVPKPQYTFLADLTHQYSLALLWAFMLWIALGSLALAQAPRGRLTTAEGWEWPQIKLGNVADFNQYCRTPPLDPK